MVIQAPPNDIVRTASAVKAMRHDCAVSTDDERDGGIDDLRRAFIAAGLSWSNALNAERICLQHACKLLRVERSHGPRLIEPDVFVELPRQLRIRIMAPSGSTSSRWSSTERMEW